MNGRELLAFLCDDPESEGAAVIARWAMESRRFHAFAVEHRNKIWKKLRTATTREGLRSVLLELEVARRFVENRACVVEYERYGQGAVRGADLTVIHRGRSVNVEVTLVQAEGAEAPDWRGKLANVVCRKLGQMAPDSLNVLVVAAESGNVSVEDVGTAMKRLKERIERRDAGLMARFGFADPAEFFKQFRRLSGIVVWQGEEPAAGLWMNPEARHPIPAQFASLLRM